MLSSIVKIRLKLEPVLYNNTHAVASSAYDVQYLTAIPHKKEQVDEVLRKKNLVKHPRLIEQMM